MSDKALVPSVDIAALAKSAGVPSDEPAVQAFAKLIATECIRVCSAARPDPTKAWMPMHHVDAAVDAVSGAIMQAFDVEDVGSVKDWFTLHSRACLAISPELAYDDCTDISRIVWVERFAQRLLELDPARTIEACEETAEQVAQSDDVGRWLGWEPGLAASVWVARQAPFGA